MASSAAADGAGPAIVAVGSTNPVKIAATEAAFKTCFPGTPLAFCGVAADSLVSDQPMGDAETRRGACNRAMNAAREYRKGQGAWPQFAVGLEGGCTDDSIEELVWSTAESPADSPAAPKRELSCAAWMAVLHVASGRWGVARTATFVLPDAVAALVRSGVELGTADDIVFGRVNSKQQNGAVGLLTKGAIDRAEYYRHALCLALVPFISAEHYGGAAVLGATVTGAGSSSECIDSKL